MQRFSPGERIDERYLLKEIIGYGGMAHVYQAHDERLDRDVALKVLRPHLTEHAQERFRREIRTLAQLHHPAVVSIYDLGLGEQIYFTMELISGGLITDLGPLEYNYQSLAKFLSTTAIVATALAYVHERGMVHRDLTPRNILLTEQTYPKVMDFGLVKLAETSKQLTRTELTLGTPQYMAPEQATGGTIGPYTDLYALGAVLYRTITGKAPYEAENDQAVLYQHVYGAVPDPRALNPALPDSLALLIMDLLAKKPEQRPLSGHQVADTLQSIQSELHIDSKAQRMGGHSQQGVISAALSHPQRLRLAWQRDLSQGPQWPSVLTSADGFLLIGLTSDEVAVIHPADGSLYRSFNTQDEVNGAILFHHERLFFSSRDGYLFAHSWPNGQALWQEDDSAVNGLSPFGKHLLVSTDQGLEQRLLDGTPLWHYETSSPIFNPATIHQGQALVMTYDGWLHSVNALTGQALYKVDIGNVVAQPACRHGIVLIPERRGDLHAFDLTSHEVHWSYDMEGELWASPICWQDSVITASWDGVLRSLELRTGDDIWANDLAEKITATPIVADGVIYAASEAGRIYAIDVRNGTTLFSEQVSSSPIQASPIVINRSLIVASVDGSLKAFR